MVCDVSVEKPHVSIVSVEDIFNQGRTYLFLGFSVYNHNYVQAFVNKIIGNKTEISIILPVIVLIYYHNKWA